MSWVREFVSMAFGWRRENLKLRNALERLLKNYDPESQCILLEADAGCIECTCGTTPNNLNTGLCAHHDALRLLGRL
jgi:hypothetical protein